MSHLLGDASAALQFTPRRQSHAGGDGRWRTRLQAVTGADKLGQSLQRVDPQLHKLALERQRTQRGARRLDTHGHARGEKKKTALEYVFTVLHTRN